MITNQDLLLLFRDMGLSLALGLLIGVERGWALRAAEPGSRVAGFRTFGLMGGLGGIGGILASHGHPWAIPALFSGAAAILVVGYALSSKLEHHVSATSAMAGLITVGLGTLATTGFPLPAAAMAVAVTFLLSLRHELHGWLMQLSELELESTLRFLLLAVVLLPLLPNQSMGPYGALNPFEIGLAVVLLSSLSFSGYWASKHFGPNTGVLMTAALGGMVSSTAVTLALARRSKEKAYEPSLIAAGILVGSLVMFARVALLASIVAAPLIPHLLPALVSAIIAGILAAGFFWRGLSHVSAPLEGQTSSNPLELRAALVFAGLLSLVMVASRWMLIHYGDQGLFAVSAITALIDVDSVTLSMGRLTSTEALPLLSHALLLAIAVNTIVKALIALFVAERRAGQLAALGFAIIFVAGSIGHIMRP